MFVAHNSYKSSVFKNRNYLLNTIWENSFRFRSHKYRVVGDKESYVKRYGVKITIFDPRLKLKANFRINQTNNSYYFLKSMLQNSGLYYHHIYVW